MGSFLSKHLQSAEIDSSKKFNLHFKVKSLMKSYKKKADIRKKESTPSKEVFVVGSGEAGELGMGPDVYQCLRPQHLEYFSDKNIIKIYAGGMHTLALSKDGKLYSWGNNDDGSLGRSGDPTIPLPVEGLERQFIISATCGDSICAALTNTGIVFQWGTFRSNDGIFGLTPWDKHGRIPMPVYELFPTVQINAGANHMVAVSKNGDVFSWGVGEQGQLARQVDSFNLLECCLTPTRIICNQPNKSSRYIAAYTGGYSTFLVHETGTVYACGLNNCGQLGLGHFREVLYPKPIPEFGKRVKIQSISGGENHTIALDQNGKAWVFGRGDDGRLGILKKGGKELEYSLHPQRLSLNSKVTKVAAGSHFTLCSTAEKCCNLKGFGFGELGQLGNGNSECDPKNELTPYRMDFNGKIIDIGAGGQFTVMLATTA